MFVVFWTQNKWNLIYTLIFYLFFHLFCVLNIIWNLIWYDTRLAPTLAIDFVDNARPEERKKYFNEEKHHRFSLSPPTRNNKHVRPRLARATWCGGILCAFFLEESIENACASSDCGHVTQWSHNGGKLDKTEHLPMTTVGGEGGAWT